MKHNALMGVHDAVKLPACNELVAVLIGYDMAEPEVPVADKAALKRFLGKFEDVDIVYKQNTADEVNIVVPVFPEFDKWLEEMEMDEEMLEYIVGGEGIIGGIIALIAVGLTTLGAAVAMKVAGAAVTGVVGAVIGATIVSTIGAAVGFAVLGAAAGIGVGIAAGCGSFDGNADPVNVSLAS